MSLFSESQANFPVLSIGDYIVTEDFLKACKEIVPVLGMDCPLIVHFISTCTFILWYIH